MLFFNYFFFLFQRKFPYKGLTFSCANESTGSRLMEARNCRADRHNPPAKKDRAGAGKNHWLHSPNLIHLTQHEVPTTLYSLASWPCRVTEQIRNQQPRVASVPKGDKGQDQSIAPQRHSCKQAEKEHSISYIVELKQVQPSWWLHLLWTRRRIARLKLNYFIWKLTWNSKGWQDYRRNLDIQEHSIGLLSPVSEWLKDHHHFRNSETPFLNKAHCTSTVSVSTILCVWTKQCFKANVCQYFIGTILHFSLQNKEIDLDKAQYISLQCGFPTPLSIQPKTHWDPT